MNILVVCLGNTCRSPMIAEMIKQAHPSWKVISRGLAIDHEQKCANQHAITLFPGLKHHIPTELTDADIDACDLVVCVNIHIASWARIDTRPILVLSVSDPNGQTLDKYQAAVAAARSFLIRAHLLPKES